MTKLEQIGVTVFAGFVVHSTAIFFFGLAAKARSTHIAPRCEARPRETIYNPNPTDPSQNRGNPWLGWIPWVLSLSYEQMLSGVPGTGTHDGGLTGNLLRVNMDNIVMLRFHSYGLRVATLGMFLYMLVLLPLYWTASCGGDDLETQAQCANITNYDQTTMSNIVVDTKIGYGLVGLSARLYVVVICMWIVTWYACYELKQEWADILAMRRYYFLESNHWQQSDEYRKRARTKSEHQQTSSSIAERGKNKLPKQTKENSAASSLSVISASIAAPLSASKKATIDLATKGLSKLMLWKRKKEEEPDYIRNRNPWVPHPNLPDTPPAVALYSVLVGGIPSKPLKALEVNEADATPDLEAAHHEEENSNREWQLAVTSAFFDHCIPNQPGFSSSVAAVTILPNAKEIASAWAKWYAAASKLRRLRFIRKQIRARRQAEVEFSPNEKRELPAEPSGDTCNRSLSHTLSFNNNQGDQTDYNREILGSNVDDDVEELFLEALNFGPAQTAVYSREFAQSASPCCPNGCFEGTIENASIEELLDLEQEGMEEVQAANKALETARLNAVTSKEAEKNTLPKEQKKKKKSDRDLSPMDSNSSNRRSKTIRAVDLPMDLTPVKNFIGNDTVKNLLGKDSSVPSDNKRRTHRRGKSSSSSKDKIDLPSDFDLEVALFKQGNMKQNSSNHGLSGTARSRCQSEVLQHSSSDPCPPKYFGKSMSYLNTEASIPSHSDSKLEEVKKNDRLPESTDLTLDDDESEVSPPLLENGVVPMKKHRAQQSEPVLHIEQDPSLLPDADESQRRLRHTTTEPLTRGISRRASLQKQRGTHNISDDPWALVEAIAFDSQEPQEGPEVDDRRHRVLSTGSWQLSSVRDFVWMLAGSVMKLLRWTTKKSNQAVVDIAADSTYAVVTFTSRQAAVAARKVLADGRGEDRFRQIDTLPIPPLADAAACDVLSCRGCCRPVTLSINDQQKKWRFYTSMVLLGAIYFFYTIPLTAAAAYANSENLSNLFPGLQNTSDGYISADILSALIGALIWSFFFAICPLMFLTISNFGSNATSSVEAEYSALKYFWWFMVVSAFSGTSLQRVILDGFDEGLNVGSELTSILQTIAATIPSQVSASWVNWIIVKTSITGPLMYNLQINSFLLDWSELKCLERATRGGGPGGPLPFRIYVDSGVVLLCLHALAPAAPLVAPFVFLYFLFSTPMLRRNVIFMYRPKFDAGGVRWPFLFDMSISSMFVGQLLLAIIMILKKSLGPCLLAAAPFLPTLWFRDAMRGKYLRAFNDVGLLQTSLLDGWDIADPESMPTREDRRKFLVDAHKASYVPVCIAGTRTDEVVTAEPAVVVATLQETETENLQSPRPAQPATPVRGSNGRAESIVPNSAESFRRSKQYGATMRRASMAFTPTATDAFQRSDFDFDDLGSLGLDSSSSETDKKSM